MELTRSVLDVIMLCGFLVLLLLFVILLLFELFELFVELDMVAVSVVGVDVDNTVDAELLLHFNSPQHTLRPLTLLLTLVEIVLSLVLLVMILFLALLLQLLLLLLSLFWLLLFLSCSAATFSSCVRSFSTFNMVIVACSILLICPSIFRRFRNTVATPCWSPPFPECRGEVGVNARFGPVIPGTSAPP